jgi:hypothetical protein
VDLLCIGDIALAARLQGQKEWAVPGGLVPGSDSQVLFNWEFPMGEKLNDTPRQRGERFRAFPDAVDMLANWAPGIAALATNHILDAGQDGLLETMGALRRAGFRIAGAGMSTGEAEQPLFWETTQGRLAIINWVFAETHPDWMAVPGPNCWPGVEQARMQVNAARRGADWVLVVAHWSDELFAYPRPEDREIASALADMGVDIVIGHHPHVVRGMEMIGSCPVFYSLGNFYFSEQKDDQGNWILKEAPRTREALGVGLSFQRGRRPEYQLFSFWNNGKEAVHDPAGRAARRLKSTSAPLVKHKNDAYARWYQRRRARFDRLDYRWHFVLRRRGVVSTLRKMLVKVQGAF